MNRLQLDQMVVQEKLLDLLSKGEPYNSPQVGWLQRQTLEIGSQIVLLTQKPVISLLQKNEKTGEGEEWGSSGGWKKVMKMERIATQDL